MSFLIRVKLFPSLSRQILPILQSPVQRTPPWALPVFSTMKSCSRNWHVIHHLVLNYAYFWSLLNVALSVLVSQPDCWLFKVISCANQEISWGALPRIGKSHSEVLIHNINLWCQGKQMHLKLESNISFKWHSRYCIKLSQIEKNRAACSLGFQFSSVAQSCPTLCDPMNRSTPGLPVHHQLPEFTQTHVHRVSDAIQPSHPRSSHSPPALNPSQHQSLFQWVNFSHQVAKVLEFQL